MTTKYFKFPFAVSGDRAAVPDPTQLDGTISYQSGYQVGYQLDYSDPASLNIPRDTYNQVMYDATLAIQQLQQNGFPEFITTAMNDGSPFSYSINACVYQPADGNNYTSLIDSNIDVPPTANWRLITFSSGIPSGVGMEYWGLTLPSGWLWQNGQTIGNASSNATARANADTSDLFTVLWGLPSTTFQLYNSAGTPVTRGVSAAADYAANRAMSLPDTRERVVAGMGTMGGTTDPNRLTTGGAGFSGAIVGANGGLETVILDTTNLAAHTHTLTATTTAAGTHNHKNGIIDSGGGNPFVYGSTNEDLPGLATNGTNGDIPRIDQGYTSTVPNHTHDVSGTSSSAGSGVAHQNTQPTIICNKIIKL